MARFAVKHLAFLLLTLFVVSFLVFALNEFSPGDVARKELGAYATQDQVEALTKRLGLDRPLIEQYGRFLRGAGRSKDPMPRWYDAWICSVSCLFFCWLRSGRCASGFFYCNSRKRNAGSFNVVGLCWLL